MAAVLLVFGACQNTPPVNRFDKIATVYCECTAQLAALNRKAATLAADTLAQAELAGYFQQMQEEYNKAKECAATIVGQYGKLKKTEFPEMEKALANKCPDLTEQRDLLQEMLGE